MISKIGSVWDVFRKGQAVADPEVLSNKAKLGNQLAALLVAVLVAAKAFGYEIELPPGTIEVLGYGLAAVYTMGLVVYKAVYRVVTSVERGLPPKADPESDATAQEPGPGPNESDRLDKL